jgi:hypothetical protein
MGSILVGASGQSNQLHVGFIAGVAVTTEIEI